MESHSLLFSNTAGIKSTITDPDLNPVFWIDTDPKTKIPLKLWLRFFLCQYSITKVRINYMNISNIFKNVQQLNTEREKLRAQMKKY